MKITPFGAGMEVTGSCYLLESKKARFLVDFGLFQGEPDTEEKNYDPLPFDPSGIHFVILTHAHMDHSGRLPLLVAGGFRGKIYMTGETRDLVEPLLLDSASIQESEKRILYTKELTERTLSLFFPIRTEETIEEKDISFSLKNSGHILGSSFIEVEAEGRHFLFSGDLGRYDSIYYQPPAEPSQTDVLLIESTYGTTIHASFEAAYEKLVREISRAYRGKSTVILPAFSIGRTAELLYGLGRYARDLDPKFRNIPIYLDSPLAQKGLEIYEKNSRSLQKGFDFSVIKGLELKILKDGKASYALDSNHDPKVILSSSGMADGGHVVHHLQNFLPDPRTKVIFTGFQAPLTLGRRLLDGATDLKIGKVRVKSRASIDRIEGLSGHADQQDLLDFIERSGARRIVLVHGEKPVMTAFQKVLSEKGYEVSRAENFETMKF